MRKKTFGGPNWYASRKKKPLPSAILVDWPYIRVGGGFYFFQSSSRVIWCCEVRSSGFSGVFYRLARCWITVQLQSRNFLSFFLGKANSSDGFSFLLLCCCRVKQNLYACCIYRHRGNPRGGLISLQVPTNLQRGGQTFITRGFPTIYTSQYESPRKEENNQIISPFNKVENALESSCSLICFSLSPSPPTRLFFPDAIHIGSEEGYVMMAARTKKKRRQRREGEGPHTARPGGVSRAPQTRNVLTSYYTVYI